MMNYYAILELYTHATQEQVKEQQRLMLHAWHPDKFPTPELKAKAEEKTKDINEAYAVLSNPSKRREYDIIMGYQPVPPPDAPAKPVPPAAGPAWYDVPPSAPAGDCCQDCGLPAPTMKVEFHRNIGMFFRRSQYSVEGKLCRDCISRYFWEMTGKTMLFGWWGVVSLFINPFFILANLIYFLRSAGLQMPPVRLAPGPAPFWVLSTLGGFALIGYLLASYILPGRVPSVLAVFARPTPTTFYIQPVQAPTSAPVYERPALTPARSYGAASNSPTCYRWGELTRSMDGNKICVT